ncbi:MAG: beta-propeller fold lactonase family protein [Balneolaceae bacterium]|nr:beta-propeller fold lactonase family protein [Balneolaceae bacterium]
MAISPDQTYAAITNYGDDKPGSTISIVNIVEHTVEKVINIAPFRRPHGIEWFSDGRRLIVSAEAQRSVIIVDVQTGTVATSIRTGQEGSHMVKLSQDEERVYVPNIGSGTLSVLDISEEYIIKTIPTHQGTEGITLTGNGAELWVTNRAANTISIINTDSLNVTNTLQSRSFPIRAETSPNGQWVAVSNAQSSEVAIFNAHTQQRITTISTETEKEENGVPIGLIFSTDSNHLYVANSEADHIVVIDTGNWEIVDRFPTGKTPDGIAYF